jgi:hypothetical protein
MKRILLIGGTVILVVVLLTNPLGIRAPIKIFNPDPLSPVERGLLSQILSGKGRPSKEDAPLLIAILRKGEAEDSACAAGALERIGYRITTSDRELIPLLINASMRYESAIPYAFKALRASYPNEKERASIILAEFERSKGWGNAGPFRVKCIEELAKLGSNALAAYPTFVEARHDADWRVSKAAIIALPRLLPHSNAPLTELVEACRYAGYPQVVVAKVREVYPKPQDQIPTYMELLGHKEAPSLRARVATELGRMRGGAKAAVPALLDALSDPDRTVKAETHWALKMIDPTAIPPGFTLPAEPFTLSNRDALPWFLAPAGAVLSIAFAGILALGLFRNV